jgi:hypothetical protein
MLAGEKTAFFVASPSAGSARSWRKKSSPKALIEVAAVFACAGSATARATAEIATSGAGVGPSVGVGTDVGVGVGTGVSVGVAVAGERVGVPSGVATTAADGPAVSAATVGAVVEVAPHPAARLVARSRQTAAGTTHRPARESARLVLRSS